MQTAEALKELKNIALTTKTLLNQIVELTASDSTEFLVK